MAHHVRVLAIDDENIVLRGVRKILRNNENYTYEIDTASSAEEGFQLATTSQYDIIFTDLVMPGMDGLELLQKLLEYGTSAKIIMFTGYATMQTALKALRMGAVDFVSKPFTSDELRNAVNKALQTQNGEGDAQTNHTPLANHVWVQIEDHIATLGVEKEFLLSVGAIQKIHLAVQGKEIIQGEEFCKIIDASNNTHILESPVAGIIICHNTKALNDYSLVCESPRTEGWLLQVEIRK